MSAAAVAPTPHTTTTPPPATSAYPRPWKWTREQYYRLGELGFFDGQRVELIRGEIVEMSPINWPHAFATGLVMDAFSRIFTTGYWLSIQSPFAVPGVAPSSGPQPDVVVVPGVRRVSSDHPAIAAVIVEVSDATIFHDTTTKAQLYAEAGVPDYWVLDLANRQLHVFRDPAPILDGGAAYRTHLTLNPTDVVSPLAAPHASLTVSDLLP